MRTKILATQTATPWLERGTDGGREIEQIELESFPFTLGRNEACDYQIQSSRVSREHAEISRTAGGFSVRDCGSTNGTFVNGQKIQETRLCAGDLLAIADVEFTFRCPSEEVITKTVTQVMGGASGVETAGHAENDDVRELIYSVRRLHESLLHRAARNRFQAVIDLHDGQIVGYEAQQRPLAGASETTVATRTLQVVDCRLTERSHQMHRQLAAEQAAQASRGTLLFLPLQPAEVGADSLPATLARLQGLVGEKRIVAGIPDSAVVDIPFFRDFLARLRELNLEVAYDGFSGGAHQVKAQLEFAPNYLKLAPALARGVDRSSQRQQQIRALVQAAAEVGAELIATGVHSENEAQMCRELGCRFAQGDHYGRPQTIDWPMDGWGLSL